MAKYKKTERGKFMSLLRDPVFPLQSLSFVAMNKTKRFLFACEALSITSNSDEFTFMNT
jgi:hypothetical protein